MGCLLAQSTQQLVELQNAVVGGVIGEDGKGIRCSVERQRGMRIRYTNADKSLVK